MADHEHIRAVQHAYRHGFPPVTEDQLADPAPVSPIATQETAGPSAWRVVLARAFTNSAPRVIARDLRDLRAAFEHLETALSSAERRIEELGRERDEETDAKLSYYSQVTTLKAEVEELKRRPDMLKQLLDDANAAHFDATMRADAAEARLASLTGHVEDTAREKVVAWMIQHSIATGHGDTLDDLLGELSAYVRKMQADRAPSPSSHRLLADAVVSRDERIASLTGQVEDMRERAALEAESYRNAWGGMAPLAEEIAADIRSLPVLPGTGRV